MATVADGLPKLIKILASGETACHTNYSNIIGIIGNGGFRLLDSLMGFNSVYSILSQSPTKCVTQVCRPNSRDNNSLSSDKFPD